MTEIPDPIADVKIRFSLRLRSDDNWNDSPWTLSVSEGSEFSAKSIHHYGWVVGLSCCEVAERFLDSGHLFYSRGYAEGVADAFEERARILRELISEGRYGEKE
jgi:hypothetical protein